MSVIQRKDVCDPDCCIVERITTNVVWSSWKPFSGSVGRNPREYMVNDKKTLLVEVNTPV
jgi:hypothetical protein